MKNTYPLLPDESNKALASCLRDIIRFRQTEDLPDFRNLPQRFIQGRLVAKIPSTPNDVAATDRVGDTSFDDDYQYTLVNVSGTPLWDRRALDTAW